MAAAAAVVHRHAGMACMAARLVHAGAASLAGLAAGRALHALHVHARLVLVQRDGLAIAGRLRIGGTK
jgi:hypothetical protein